MILPFWIVGLARSEKDYILLRARPGYLVALSPYTLLSPTSC